MQIVFVNIYFFSSFSSLPSVIAKALGKAGSLPSAISIYTWQTLVFAECFPVKTLGKATVTVFAPSSYLFFAESQLNTRQSFAECPKNNTWQRPLCRVFGCRVVYAVGGTRQSLCRVHLGLCRVP